MNIKKKTVRYINRLCFDIVSTATDDDNDDDRDDVEDEYAFKSPAAVETSSKPTHSNFSLPVRGTRYKRARGTKREVKKRISIRLYICIVCCC